MRGIRMSYKNAATGIILALVSPMRLINLLEGDEFDGLLPIIISTPGCRPP